MKKILMGSLALMLFSVSIIVFQVSCKKDATAQQVNVCSETATVVFDVSFPLNYNVSATERSADNGVELYTSKNSLNSSSNGTSRYCQFFKYIGSILTKTYTMNNVIPGQYVYVAYLTNAIPNSTPSNYKNTTTSVPITIQAGQTYHFTINSADFH